jgi:hypothetical protein
MAMEDLYALCVNGEVRKGDLVLSTPGDAYGCLIGTVREIRKLGTAEHEAVTTNGVDIAFADFFDLHYTEQRKNEIRKKFIDAYQADVAYGNCPLDDAIMPVDRLIRITGIEREKLLGLAESYKNAAAFCHAALRVRKLTDRLDKNLSGYHEALLRKGKRELIEEAGMITSMSDAHYYLTECHAFDDDEAKYLLLFENPLEVVADAWYERVSLLDDFTFALHEVFDKRDALASGSYPLSREPALPEPPVVEDEEDEDELDW